MIQKKVKNLLSIALALSTQSLTSLSFLDPIYVEESPISLTLLLATTFDIEDEEVVLSKDISGKGSLIKFGSGTLELSGSNTYTGDTILMEGSLKAGSAKSFSPNSSIVLSDEIGVTLDLNNFNCSVASISGGGTILLGSAVLTADVYNFDMTFSGNILGSGSFVKKGNATLVLSGEENSYTGSTQVVKGVLQAGSSSAFPSNSSFILSNEPGVVLDLNGFSSIVGNISGGGSLGGSISLGFGNLIAGSAHEDVTFAGNISGEGSFIKVGAGTLTLTGVNTYSGETSIVKGSLQVNSDSLPGDVINDSTLIFNQMTNGVYEGQILGTGSLQKTGEGSLTLAPTRANAYSGHTILTKGTLKAGSVEAFSPDSLFILSNTENVVLDLNDFDVSLAGVSGGGKIFLGEATLEVGNADMDAVFEGSIAGTGNFVKKGLGTLMLTGASSFTGDFFLDEGQLVLVNDKSLGHGTFYMEGGSNLEIAANVAISNTMVLSGTNRMTIPEGLVSLSKNISGEGIVIKLGPGALTLTGVNTYRGETSIVKGSLQVNSDSLPGDVINDSTLIFNQMTNGVYEGQILGTGSLQKTGEGSLTLTPTRANAYSGHTILTKGTLKAGSVEAFSPDSLFILSNTENVVLDLNDFDVSLAGVSGGGKIFLGEATLEVGNADMDAVFEGSIAGTGNFVKKGLGTLMLTGASSFTGDFFLDEGQLVLVNDKGLGHGTFYMEDGSNLEIAANVAISNPMVLSGTNRMTIADGVVSLSKNISGEGSFIKLGAGTLTLTGVNTYRGETSIVKGSLQVNSDSLPGDVINDSTLIFNQMTNGVYEGQILGTGSLQKTGEGSLTLTPTRANEYSGHTILTKGTLKAGSVEAFSPDSLFILSNTENVVLDLNDFDMSLAGVSGGGKIFLGEATLEVGSADMDAVFEGSIAGTGNFVKKGLGTLMLTGASSFTGDFFLDEGQLVLVNDKSLGHGTFYMEDGSNLEIASNVSLSNTIVLSGTNRMTIPDGLVKFSGDIRGFGDLIKTGEGTLVLTHTEGYMGSVLAIGGILQVDGWIYSDVILNNRSSLKGIGTIFGSLVVKKGGTASPGNSPGIQNVIGPITFHSGAALNISIGLLGDHSELNSSDRITIETDSTLNLIFSPEYRFSSQKFTIMTADNILGQFDHILLSSSLLKADVLYQSKSIQVGVQLADFNDLLKDTNAINVGDAISQIVMSANVQLDSVVLSLIELSNASEVESALNDMQPALYKGLAISQENNVVKIRNTLGYRFDQELNESHCYQPQIGKADKKIKETCRKEKRVMNVWVDGFGDLLQQDSNRYASSPQVGYQTKSDGVSLGVDGGFADYFYVGALGAYTDSNVKWIDGKGKGDIQTGYGGLYFSAISDLFYGNMAVIRAWSHYSAERSILYPGVNLTAKNNHGGSQLLSHADTGLNLGVGGFTVRPFDSFDYITQTEEKFTESDAGAWNLDVRKSNAIMLRNELGVQFAGCVCFDSSKWTISPKISWVREVRIKGKGYTAEFINTEVPFQVTGYFPNRSLVSPGVLVTGLMWEDRLALDLYYSGEFASHYSDHNYGGQLRFGF